MRAKGKKPAMKRSHRNRKQVEHAAVLDALFQMEPQLRLLGGSVALLTRLGESTEPVEPAGLATLAHVSSEAIEEIMQSWRECRDLLRF